MAHTITLSAEEMALIEQKRAEEKAKAEALLRSYDHYKEKKIEAEQKTIERLEKEQEERKKLFEDFLAQLNSVSPNFKLHCKRNKSNRQIDLYEIDNECREIKFSYDEEGGIKSYLKAKEIIKFDSYYYDLKLSYTGKLPETHEFYIVPIAQYSKYSSRISGYKMQIQGTGINSWERTGQMTKPESVVKKLNELSESAFRQIEYAEAERLRKDRVEAEFKKQYGHLEKEATIEMKNRQFIIKFKNEIELIVNGYENGETVRFSYSKISLPYGIDVNKLIEGLKNI